MKSIEADRVFLVLCSALALLAGCGGGETAETTPEGPTWARDVEPLVHAKCAVCHTEGGIGPFPLETYEDVSARAGSVASAVKSRTMPPWTPAEGCTEYKGDFSLSDAQIDVLAAWADAGAPMGDPGEAPVEVEGGRLTLSRVDLELPLPEPYTQQIFPDDYRCFFLDWPEAETTYVTGFGARPDNAGIVHHLIAYVVPPDAVATFQALDDAAPGPGWPCFGGPGGEAGKPGQVSWLSGWAPGGLGQDFPEGTGVEVAAGSKIIVQMHYNSPGMSPAPDRTSIVLRTDAAVEKRAGVMPFADFQWLQGKMPIPAHSGDVVHAYDADPTALAPLLTGGAIQGGVPLTVYTVGGHMHTLGRRIETHVTRAGGAEECLLDIPRWNFHWQYAVDLAAPVQVAPGDQLHLECHWDNAGDADVNWGEGTGDEMCLGVYYVTE